MKKQSSCVLRLAVGAALLAGAASAGATQLAPYFYTWGYGNSSYAVTSLMDARNKMGLDAATLAFVVSAGGCTVDTSISNMQSDIAAFQSAGGRVIISFGGANGTYVESACNATQLTALIDGMLQTTGARAIDFDVEGGQLGNNALNTTRNAAIKALRQKYPNLYVSLTLPALPVHPGWGGGGLDDNGLRALQSAAAAGATIDIVNLMAMDFGGSYHDGSTMAQLTLSAANAAVAQLAGVYPSKSDAQLWAMLGITSMIGVNDVSGETFTTADAATLARFVQSKGVGHLSYWALQRDRPGNGSLGEYSQVPQSAYQFYDTFKSAAGPATTLPGAPTTPSTPPTPTTPSTPSTPTTPDPTAPCPIATPPATPAPAPATLAVTAAWSGDASKVTTQPTVTVQAACSTSGTKTATFKPPAAASITGLVAGESCTLTETSLSGATVANGYAIASAAAATFTPNPALLAAGSNAANVTNKVLAGAAGDACQPAWSAEHAYVGGDRVSRNNINYAANWWTQNNDPTTNSGATGSGLPWTSEGACR
jgi:chitinase